MVGFDDKWIIDNLEHKEFILGMIEDKEHVVDSLQSEIKELKAQVYVLNRVSEIVDGVAINDFYGGRNNIYGGPNHKFTQVCGNRWADVYINAHNRTTYGVRIGEHGYDGGDRLQQGGKWLGSHFKYDEAVSIAKTWITKGEYDGGQK